MLGEEIYRKLIGKSPAPSNAPETILSSPDDVASLLWNGLEGVTISLEIRPVLTKQDGIAEQIKAELRNFFIVRLPDTEFHPKYGSGIDLDLS